MPDVLNPMIAYYAEQSLQHAARHPYDQAAQAQAAHWSGLLQQQRQAQMQMQQMAASGGQQPTEFTGVPQHQPSTHVPMFGSNQPQAQTGPSPAPASGPSTVPVNPFQMGSMFPPTTAQDERATHHISQPLTIIDS